MMTWEDQELKLLREATALDIVALQANLYVAHFQHRPSLITVNLKCKAAICVEIMQTLSVPASEVIIEPLWLDSIPVIFDKLGDDFIKLENKSAGSAITL